MAVAIASFCLVSTMALLPVGIASNKTAIDQTSAMNVLSAVAADIKTTPGSSGTVSSTRYGISIPPVAPSGGTSTTVQYVSEDGQSFTAAQFASGTTNAIYQLTATVMAPSQISVTSSSHTGPRGTWVTSTNSYQCRSATQAHLQVSWPAQISGSSSANSVETVVSLDRN